MQQLAQEITQGRRLTREDDLERLLTADLEELSRGADQIRRALCGDGFDFCSVISGRSGRCSEDCRFCAQSRCSHAPVEAHPFLPAQDILAEGKCNEESGIYRYSVVTVGRGVHGKDLEKSLEAYRLLRKETNLALCVSHGLQSVEEMRALKEAGVTQIHSNLETSRRYFPQICSTHTYQDKVDNVLRAKEAELKVCSGGILGLGETWQDRLDLALELAGLEVDSIPLNLLRPIPGTPLENVELISEEDVIRATAIFRYLNPTAWIRIAAGRDRFPDGGEKFFRAGANAAITGNMLTIEGTTITGDLELIERLGFHPEIPDPVRG